MDIYGVATSFFTFAAAADVDPAPAPRPPVFRAGGALILFAAPGFAFEVSCFESSSEFGATASTFRFPLALSCFTTTRFSFSGAFPEVRVVAAFAFDELPSPASDFVASLAICDAKVARSARRLVVCESIRKVDFCVLGLASMVSGPFHCA